ncbi:3-oxoacyl-[acyl-carrier-protein] synthase-3 [Oxalobacteraceae bacterium GrIS 1.11]
MNTINITVSAIAYELGEYIHVWRDLPGIQEKMNSFGMTDDPELWGLGQFRRTKKTRIALALDSAHQTMQKSGLAPSDIDALIVCAVSLPDDIENQVEFTNALARELQIVEKPLFGLSLNRCATLLSGLQMARTFVLSGEFKNILVIGVDLLKDEDGRLERFAIFSDGAASCVVSSEIENGYQIKKTAWKGSLLGANAALDMGIELASNVTQELEIVKKASSLSKVFHDNLFIPIVSMREQMAGFSENQLYLSNISRFGHCFSCDPLINLSDYEMQSPLAQGSSFLLACSTPGVRTALLLQK